MRIALDVSPLANDRAGIGTYIAHLLTALVRVAPDHEYLFYTPHLLPEKDRTFFGSQPNVRIVHSPAMLMGLRARWDRVDIFHGLNFKLRGWGRFGGVVTIYDLSRDRLPQPSRKLSAQRRSFVRTRLDAAVVFPGHVPVEDLRVLYSNCVLFAFPSLYEGFGMPVLEAMACGSPVVSSNTSSLPDLAGDAALLVDPRDPEAWAQAMTRVFEDGNLRDDLRRRGALRTKAFSWEQSARDLLRVYLGLERSKVER